MTDELKALADLLPCPFCGGEARLFKGGSLLDPKPWACCYGNEGVRHRVLSMPITAWNTRATINSKGEA